MSTSRLDQLRQFLADDPADPFNTYALALECLKSDKQEAESLLMSLLENHPRYLPAYYQAASMLAATGRIPQALRIAEKGIALAQTVGDQKARRELQAQYDEWSDEV